MEGALKVSDPRPPADVGEAGKKLWRSVMRDMSAAGLAFDARERAMFYRCTKMAERIAAMDRELDGAEPLVPGYLGKGVVSNPILTELRQTEALLAQTLQRLKPPADEDEQQRQHIFAGQLPQFDAYLGALMSGGSVQFRAADGSRRVLDEASAVRDWAPEDAGLPGAEL